MTSDQQKEMIIYTSCKITYINLNTFTHHGQLAQKSYKNPSHISKLLKSRCLTKGFMQTPFKG